MPSRRTFVASVAAASSVLAGCTGGGDATETTVRGETATRADDGSTRTTGATTDRTTETTQDSPVVDLALLERKAVDGPIRVLPGGLRTLLADAARADGPVRDHYQKVFDLPPSPVLGVFDTVELRGTDGADGVYDVDVQAGGRYEMRFEGNPVSSVPDDATVVAEHELTTRQRQFVADAVDDRATVYPETVLGTWARTVFQGGYVRFDGTVYRGREQQQTDVEFFAPRIWYVVTLTPVEGAADPFVLNCALLDVSVERTVFEALREDDGVGPVERVADPPPVLLDLAREFDAVLLHNRAPMLSVV
jgi:hypothetical protein